MAMHNLSKELEKLFKKKTNETYIIHKLDELIHQYGLINMESWRNFSNTKKNSLLHELVDKQYYDVMQYIVPKYNLKIFIKRESDGSTPFELAHTNQDWKMCNLLLEFSDKDTYEQFAVKKQKDKLMNIVWLDLEFTSFEDPKILECAVIITDKDLNELERKEWVIHFEQNILDGLGEWHQNAFKDQNDGGNGLFSDVINSQLKKEQVEEELLDLLKRHCPEKACPLAGSSIHIDREVLKTEMPNIHRYLHYRVIDVSSFREMMKRWAPFTASKFVRQIAANGKQAVTHRAMDDIEWSIELMKMFKPLLTAKQSTKSIINESDAGNGKHTTFEKSMVQKSKLPMIISNIDKSKLYSDEKRLIERLKYEQEFDVYSLKLNSSDQRLYDQNPHLREIFINKKQILINDKEFTTENRLLDLSSNGSTSTINKINPTEINTTEHWGQRKLILSEIEFLTKYIEDENYLVVYAGAAPGTHLNYLSSLFPQVKFVLIDKDQFVATESDKIKIKHEVFSENLAKKYAENYEKILFICNIRSFTMHEYLEQDIAKDNNNLMIWQSTMRPYASLLTLRFPYSSEKISFYQGDILLDIWSSRQNTQCRLIVEKDAQMIDYDITSFQRAMNNFQNINRIMYYQHDLDSIENEGLDHCYDCRAEIFILQNYLIKIRMITDEIELKTKIAQLSYEISRNIHEKNKQPIINVVRTLNIIPKK